jgi:hypothetical protein
MSSPHQQEVAIQLQALKREVSFLIEVSGELAVQRFELVIFLILLRDPCGLVVRIPDTGDPDKVIFFLIYLILLSAISHGVHSASNRNEYQEHKNIFFCGVIAAGA